MIQFLNYAQNLEYTIVDWDGVAYRQVTFIIRDFITYQNSTISYKNRYQLQKTQKPMAKRNKKNCQLLTDNLEKLPAAEATTIAPYCEPVLIQN